MSYRRISAPAVRLPGRASHPLQFLAFASARILLQNFVAHFANTRILALVRCWRLAFAE